jgi:hypothetical protein
MSRLRKVYTQGPSKCYVLGDLIIALIALEKARAISLKSNRPRIAF